MTSTLVRGHDGLRQTSSIVVLAPTRGRPERAGELVESFLATAHLPATRLVLVIDRNDPRRGDYLDGQFDRLRTARPYGWPQPSILTLEDYETGDLVKATNSAVRRLRGHLGTIVGHVGDDHRFRTPGWDTAVTVALLQPGIAYGDDGTHGHKLGTSWFVSTSIVDALGWLAYPGCRHLYIDRVWMTLADRISRRMYLSDVHIEHMHPEVGKAEWDDGYRQANSPEMWTHDRKAYDAWLRDQADLDVAGILSGIATGLIR